MRGQHASGVELPCLLCQTHTLPARSVLCCRGVVLLNAAGRFEEGAEGEGEAAAVATPEQQSLWAGLVEQGERASKQRQAGGGAGQPCAPLVRHLCPTVLLRMSQQVRARGETCSRGDRPCLPPCFAPPACLPRSRHGRQARGGVCVLCVHQAARPHPAGAAGAALRGRLWHAGMLPGRRHPAPGEAEALCCLAAPRLGDRWHFVLPIPPHAFHHFTGAGPGVCERPQPGRRPGALSLLFYDLLCFYVNVSHRSLDEDLVRAPLLTGLQGLHWRKLHGAHLHWPQPSPLPLLPPGALHLAARPGPQRRRSLLSRHHRCARHCIAGEAGQVARRWRRRLRCVRLPRLPGACTPCGGPQLSDRVPPAPARPPLHAPTLLPASPLVPPLCSARRGHEPPAVPARWHAAVPAVGREGAAFCLSFLSF